MFFICSSFFGGGFGFGFGNQGGQREIPRGGTITMEMHVSLEDLYKGSFIEVHLHSCVCVCVCVCICGYRVNINGLLKTTISILVPLILQVFSGVM